MAGRTRLPAFFTSNWSPAGGTQPSPPLLLYHPNRVRHSSSWTRHRDGNGSPQILAVTRPVRRSPGDEWCNCRLSTPGSARPVRQELGTPEDASRIGTTVARRQADDGLYLCRSHPGLDLLEYLRVSHCCRGHRGAGPGMERVPQVWRLACFPAAGPDNESAPGGSPSPEQPTQVKELMSARHVRSGRLCAAEGNRAAGPGR